jgi:hypothetical protein
MRAYSERKKKKTTATNRTQNLNPRKQQMRKQSIIYTALMTTEQATMAQHRTSSKGTETEHTPCQCQARLHIGNESSDQIIKRCDPMFAS